jgi:dual-specificity kinase
MAQEMICPDTELNRALLDLLREMFVYDPAKRITAEKALRNRYFKIPASDEATLIATRKPHVW